MQPFLVFTFGLMYVQLLACIKPFSSVSDGFFVYIMKYIDMFANSQKFRYIVDEKEKEIDP